MNNKHWISEEKKKKSFVRWDWRAKSILHEQWFISLLFDSMRMCIYIIHILLYVHAGLCAFAPAKRWLSTVIVIYKSVSTSKWQIDKQITHTYILSLYRLFMDLLVLMHIRSLFEFLVWWFLIGGSSAANNNEILNQKFP